ncbi:VWA domain-containing protein [Candidatus Pacearchaeota archaeon]|nr:VWA domain-containing protein [Candidatus Pacearchaeota archaeon]
MIVTFTHPLNLLFLFFIPVIILIHFISIKSKRKTALQFSNFDAIARIKGIDLYSKNIVILSCSISICLFLVLSIAGTIVQYDALTSSSSLVIAVDSSRSMEANDILPSRFEAAKTSLSSFIGSYPAGTRVGIVSFSGSTLIEQDITSNKDLLRQSLGNVQLSSIGGTDLYEAIVTAVNLLRPEDYRAIILLSDGRFNVGNIQEAIDYATKNSVLVHTIALGTETGGETTYGISKVELDSLESISFLTGGKAFHAESAAVLAQSLDQIKNLKVRRVSLDASGYCALAALLIFIFEYLLFNTRYRVFP